jgi:RNA polymerase-binding protein DksA
MNEYQEIARRLRSELAELTQRAKAIEDELSHPLDADSSEQAVDLEDDETLEGVGEVLREQIRDIQQAMLRIDRGEYGTCARCGGEIGLARLNALPTATHCIDCAD